MFPLFKIFRIIKKVFYVCIFEFTAYRIADNSKIRFRNHCDLLLQYFTLLLTNTLKDIVWRAINLFTLQNVLHHGYCKRHYVYLKCLQVWLTASLFAFEMSIYFIFSTTLQDLSWFIWNQTKLNQKKPVSSGEMCCCCFKFINKIC